MQYATLFLRSLGVALRERREEIGLTQEAVSLRTGVPQRRIWELEAGVGNPTARTLLRLVSGLDISCSRLIARAEQLAEDPAIAEAVDDGAGAAAAPPTRARQPQAPAIPATVDDGAGAAAAPPTRARQPQAPAIPATVDDGAGAAAAPPTRARQP